MPMTIETRSATSPASKPQETNPIDLAREPQYGRMQGSASVTKLTLGLAQITTKLGNPQANLEKHIHYIDQARKDNCDLVIFPELSLTGYALQDLVPDVACRPVASDPFFGPLLQASRDIDVMVWFVDDDARHRFCIAEAYLSRGEVVHVHHKIYLCTYGMFDEGRFFAPGESARAFDTRFGRVGMLICEDFWHASPPYLLWQDGADLLLFSSASPGRGLTGEAKLESSAWVEHINRAYASLFTAFVAHCNRSGFEDGLNFWGGSTVYDPDGQLVAQAPYFEEALIHATIDLNHLKRTRARLPLLRDEKPEFVERELGRIIHGR
jgi:NAD+ synthase (glutamine-hydrolysing)